MNRSVRIAGGYILLVAAVFAGFMGGRYAGARMRPHADHNLAPWTPGSSNPEDAQSAPIVPPNEVFASVLDKVEHDYVGTTAPVTAARLTEGALGRMLASVQDQHYAYLDPDRAQTFSNSLLGHRTGTGAELTITASKSALPDIEDRFLTVKSISAGSPAERAGLHTGDRITEIDGQWVIAYAVPGQATPIPTASVASNGSRATEQSGIKPGIPAVTAIRLLTTGAGKALHLVIARPGVAGPIEVSVTTAPTEVPQVAHRLIADGVTYLRIAQFNGQTGVKVASVLDRKVDWANGLIVDLRRNPGGVEADTRADLDGLHAVISLLQRVCESGCIAQLERRQNQDSEKITASRSAGGSVRVAVIVDSGTANLAEMAAAGLRDAAGARLVGAQTAGDNVLERYAPMLDGGAVMVPAAHILTARGAPVIGGLKPDIKVRDAGGSAALDAAIRYVNGDLIAKWR